MPPLSIEERVAALEEQVAAMKKERENSPHDKPWIRTMGKFEDLKEIFDEAMKLREQDRARARRRFAKKKISKSKAKK